MTISINQLKKGLTILMNGQVFFVLDSQHIKPGKGAAFARVKLKNVKTGAVVDKTFRCEEKIEEAFVEQKKIQYQYNSHDTYHFMNLENFEEVLIDKDNLGSAKDFLKDYLQLTAIFYQGRLLNVELPSSVEFKVIRTEAGIRGNTVKAGSKGATIESGLKIRVPLFINEGDIIKVDTRTGQYTGRIS